MKTSFGKPATAGRQRYLLGVLVLLCLVLVAYAGWRGVTRLGDARAEALDTAEQAIGEATLDRIEQDRVPNRLIESVDVLVESGDLGLNYLTLRNADRVTLVSRGRFGERFGFLPADLARQARSWAYRLQSAETTRPLTVETQRIGYAQFGIGWWTIAGQAGTALLIWLLALLAGLVGLIGALGALRALPASSEGDHGASADAAKTTAPAVDPAPAPRARRTRRRLKSNDEFAPIEDTRRADRPGEPARSDPPSRPETPSQPASAAKSVPATTPASKPAKPPAPPQKTAEPEPAPSNPAPAQPPEPKAKPAAHATPAKPARTPATKPKTPLHVPSMDAQPQLGDDTLDLRFYPIWHDSDRKILAGACAALAWRIGETRLVDADTLTKLAEQDGALRAFTQWIARRFSLLHSNWRTLEINTVPIVLPIPSAMLAFADAEAVWRDALRRTDRDPNDLVLWLGARSRRNAHAALPVRRALSLTRHDAGLPADCDLVCINPEHVGDDLEPWYERIDKLECPVLVGPVEQPDAVARLIGHKRVLWFSQTEDDLYTPRAFARLLARSATQPM